MDTKQTPIEESSIDIALDRLTNYLLEIHPKYYLGASCVLGILATTSLQNLESFSYSLGLAEGLMLGLSLAYIFQGTTLNAICCDGSTQLHR